MELPLTDVRDPEAALEPDGFMVEASGGDRIHFLDWGSGADEDQRPLVLGVHGLGQTAWIWAPVARRLSGLDGPARFLAADLRGHGLSDAPTDGGAYDLEVLADDVLAVAEAAGAFDRRRLVLAGHGFGAIVSAVAAQRAGEAIAGLVLVDGGWESIEASSGLDVDEFLRGLDEPPEVMASLDAFLADRRGFDPPTWDADQERATRATVVETHAGRVVPAARPHATEACVRAMFTYDPIVTLRGVAVPVVALAAADDEERSRSIALAEVAAVRAGAGLDPIEVVRFPHDGHNLMRYRPREVAAAILTLARPRPT